ncbi:potassium channel subfamily K member 18 [Microcaecilia unicolor]|uniref:Potassium channel subfamily K member 18 n=1 Tax=Microcaecilia unicolor TaxID=1415580 RepID=A0A6P7Y6F4_9AMPH|nr:potassium channel subfamily K member 18 [Microcaecilia unicolor]
MKQGPQQQKWTCLYLFWVAFPHVCLILSLVLYSILGALMFHKLEGARRERNKELDMFLEKVWNSSQNLCNSTGNLSSSEEFVNTARTLFLAEVKSEWLQTPQTQWNFMGSLFFCCTVFTTVGYGHISPATDVGKFACIVYAAVGIPLMLLVLADLGDILASTLTYTYNRARKAGTRVFSQLSSTLSCRDSSLRTKPKNDDSASHVLTIKEPLSILDVLKSQSTVKKKSLQMQNTKIFEMIIAKENLKNYPQRLSKYERSISCPELKALTGSQLVLSNLDKIGEELGKLNVPVVLIVFIMIAYILCGAFILPIWEKEWSYTDAFYFCFITLTTIGFGDIIPQHPNFFLLLSLYIIIGMAIMCMAFKLGQNRLVYLYKRCISCISGGKVKAEQISSDFPELKDF